MHHCDGSVWLPAWPTFWTQLHTWKFPDCIKTNVSVKDAPRKQRLQQPSVRIWPVALCCISYPLRVAPFSFRVKPQKGKQLSKQGGCEVREGSDHGNLRTRPLFWSQPRTSSASRLCLSQLWRYRADKKICSQTDKQTRKHLAKYWKLFLW